MGPDILDYLGELEASHVRHSDIRHQQVDTEATRQDTEGQLSIARFDDAIAGIPEASNDRLADYVVILDDQDGSWLRWLVWHGGAWAAEWLAAWDSASRGYTVID